MFEPTYLLGQAVGANGHGHRQHCWHGDRNASDEQNKQVVDSITVTSLLDGEHDDQLHNNSDEDGDDAETSNARQHLWSIGQGERALITNVLLRDTCDVHAT